MENAFYFTKKTLFFFEIFKLLLFFVYLFNVLKSWTAITMPSWNGQFKFWNKIVETTQKALKIKVSKLSTTW